MCWSWGPHNHTHLPAVPQFTPRPPPLRLQFSFLARGSPSCGGSPALHPAACLLQPSSPAGHVVPAASLWALSGEASGRAGGAIEWQYWLAGCPGSMPGC